MAGGKRKGVEPIVVVGVSVLILVACVSWSFRASNFIAGSFRMDDIQICEELDENLRPLRPDRNMSAESLQACLWFSYSRARRGDIIEIEWYLDEKLITKETVRLSEPRGVRAFFLLKDDGSPLDAGFYSVRINCNGREMGMENFTVSAPVGDDSAGDAPESD
jgi:hypothetical protein